MIGKKIKVLQVVPILGYGGVEKIVVNYYNNLNHDEFVFDFIGHGKSAQYVEQLKAAGCKIFEISTIGSLGYSGYKKQIQENVDVESYDVIHIHIGHITGVYAKVFRDLGAKKIVCHAHTTRCVNQKHKLFMPLFRHLAVLYSDVLIACGKDAGKYCFGKAEYVILPNGLNFDVYKSITCDDVDGLKTEFGINDGTLVIGHVGHFSKQKNHPFLTEIIHDYAKMNNNVKFILVGDGPDKGDIEKIIQKNGDGNYVIFAGIRNDIPALMKMFDIFVLPSLFEGLPVVGIEAQAAGTPCVFSDTIDKTVSICDSHCEFVPIEKGTVLWIDAINRMRNCGRNLEKNIYDALCKNGYDLVKSAENLGKIYRFIIGDEKNEE